VTQVARGYHDKRMHFADSIVIFLLALVLFGPKKLPEIGRQIGKLLAEFRRASNDFKMQIDEELRAMEQQERQKKLESAAAEAEKTALPPPESSTEPSILPPETAPLAISPPSTGEIVSASSQRYCRNIEPGSPLERPRRRIRCHPAERRGDQERRYPRTSWMTFSTAPDRR
jgi:TatA/E family protein of Tat protein translocase